MDEVIAKAAWKRVRQRCPGVGLAGPDRESASLRRMLSGAEVEVQLGGWVARSASTVDLVWDLETGLEFGYRRILMLGERGVGKSRMARAIATELRCPAERYQHVNCASLPEELADALLFGAAAGAYTGAKTSTHGFVGSANGGVLFLDEILLAPAEVLPKLLLLLEEGTFRAVGAKTAQPFAGHIVAATNKYTTRADLSAACRDQMERADLVDRFEMVLEIPALEHRFEEVGSLADEILESWWRDAGKSGRPPRLHADTRAAISDEKLARAWPGNLRDLRSLLLDQVRFREVGPSGLLHIPPDELFAMLLGSSGGSPPPGAHPPGAVRGRGARYGELLEELRRAHEREGFPFVDARWVLSAMRAAGHKDPSRFLQPFETTGREIAELLTRRQVAAVESAGRATD